MSFRTRRRTVAAFAAVLLLSACSGGSDDSSATGDAAGVETSIPDGAGTAGGGGSTATTQAPGTDITVPQATTTTVAPLIELPTDERIELGETTSETQDVAEACAEAIAPIRVLMASKASGVLMDDADREVLNQGLAAGRQSCDATDWAAFQQDELHGWMYAAVD